MAAKGQEAKRPKGNLSKMVEVIQGRAAAKGQHSLVSGLENFRREGRYTNP